MAEQFFTLGGKRVVSGRITIPYHGTWAADLELAGADLVQGATVLVCGDLSLAGTVRASRTASFAGKVMARVVGGADGWNKAIPPKGYSHDAGVKLSTILQDAARTAGEKIAVEVDRTVGTTWARREGKASRVLRRLLEGKWWMDEGGTTQTKERTATKIAVPFQVISYAPNLGAFEIATEIFKEWAPGRKFQTATLTTEQTISSVTFEAKAGKIRVHIVNTDSKEERLLKSIRDIIRDEVARLETGTIVEYEITSAEEMKIACKPASKDSPWPPLADVKLKAGLFGEVVKPTVGKKALIVFMDDDPALYRCIGVEGPNQTTKFETSEDITATAGGVFKVCGGGNFAALANLVDQNFTDLCTKFDSHIHGTGVGPSTPPTPPLVKFPSTTCTKLKTD